MKLRSLLIVVAALAALSVIAFVARRPPAPASADARVNQPVIASSLLEQTARLRLIDQGKSVSLVRQPDNTWRVADYHDFPADFSKLSTLVSQLADARVQRLVTSNPERIARLEFKDTKIELVDPAGESLATLTLGKHADNGGRYVRYAEESRAYLANLDAWLDPEAKNWTDTTLVNLKPEEIAKLELTFPNAAPLTFTRAKPGDPWSSSGQLPADHTIDTAKIASVLNSLTSLRFSDTTAPDDPKIAEAAPHPRTVKLTTFESKTVSLTFTRRPEEKKLKPPTPSPEGPAALGSLDDVAKKDAPASAETKLPEPEFETIPPGPVFVSVSHSTAAAPVNALMQKRAFQISDYTFTSLPQQPTDLFTAPASVSTESPAPNQ